MARYLIRNLNREDIPSLMVLPRIEGRHMGLEAEVETWMKFDPQGIFVAVNGDGDVVGCCSGMALSEHHGYLGMYVVSRKCRGEGLGRILWNAAVDHLGDRNLCLSSVEKMVANYRDKASFSIVSDWTVDLYSCTTAVLPSCIPSAVLPDTLPVDNKFMNDVLDYDNLIHSYDRSTIVESTLREPGTLCMVAVKQFHPAVVGYSCIKKGLQGKWIIAPLYADDYYVAYSLLYGLLGSLTTEQREQGVVAKLVSSNLDASKLMQAFGLKKTSYYLRRCFTKEVVDIPLKKIFALQSSIFCTE